MEKNDNNHKSTPKQYFFLIVFVHNLWKLFYDTCKGVQSTLSNLNIPS